jgi:hypothetical protein
MPFPDFPPLTYPSCLCYPTSRDLTRAETFVFLVEMNRRPYRLDEDGCMLLDLKNTRVLVAQGHYIVWHGPNLYALDRARFLTWKREPANTPHIMLSEDVRCAVQRYTATGEEDEVEAAPIWLNDNEWRYGPALNTTLAYLLRDYKWNIFGVDPAQFTISMNLLDQPQPQNRVQFRHGDWLVRTSVGLQVIPDAAFQQLFTRA